MIGMGLGLIRAKKSRRRASTIPLLDDFDSRVRVFIYFYFYLADRLLFVSLESLRNGI